jgi:uncharacterized protein
MSVDQRVDTLKQRHAGIEARLHDEETRPAPDPGQVHKLKREKLKIKDEITRLAHA